MNLRSHRPGGVLTIDEYIVVYYYSDTDKVVSQIPTNSIRVGTKGHPTDTRKDSRLSFTPPGRTAFDVLCSGVHETHSLRLEYCDIE